MSQKTSGPAFAKELLALGSVLGKPVLDATMQMYLRQHQSLPASTSKVIKDLHYGQDARQTLDVHLPHTTVAKAAMPSVIHFHGGSFIGGNKNVGGDFIYGNVANFFAEKGLIGINATYRTAPNTIWPAASQDVAAALKWAIDHVAEYGGDPRKIFIIGQSAGAAHVANYAFRKEMHLPLGAGFCGVVLLAGTYSVIQGNISDNASQYYGKDETQYPKMHLFNNITATDFPVYIGYAEFDPPAFKANSQELCAQLIRQGAKAPSTKLYEGHNHFSATYSFRTNDVTVSNDILNFCLENQ